MTPAVQEQLARLWSAHYQPVVSMLASKGTPHAQAEEYAQQAFIQVGQALERGGVNEPAALLRLAANRIAVDAWRAEHPVVGKDEDGEDVRLAIIPFNPELDVQREDEVVRYRPWLDFEFAPALNRGLEKAGADARAAFALTELRGLTVREAADLLGTSKSDVARKAAAATTSIRKELAA